MFSNRNFSYEHLPLPRKCPFCEEKFMGRMLEAHLEYCHDATPIDVLALLAESIEAEIETRKDAEKQIESIRKTLNAWGAAMNTLQRRVHALEKCFIQMNQSE